MKKITALLSVVLMVVLCALSVAAAEDYMVWDFTDEADVAQWKPSSTTKVTVTENGAVISG